MRILRLSRAVAVLAAPAVLVGTATAAPAAAAPASRPGLTAAAAVQADAGSVASGLSADGRFVLFMSRAANLVPGDTNGQIDLFVRDRATGVTQLVDVTAAGAVPSRGISAFASISADGRYVAFSSAATDLVPGDSSGLSGTFLRDLRRHTTERISVRPDGTAADGGGWPAGVSRGGRYVVFVTAATDLDPADTAVFPRSVYVRDRALRTTHRIVGIPFESLAPAWNAMVSPDGRFVAADIREPAAVPGGPAGNWGVTLFDLRQDAQQRISHGPDGSPGNAEVDVAAVSRTGRAVLYSAASNLVAGDTNGVSDVFVVDHRTGSTRLVSAAADGTPGNAGSALGAISPDGRFVAFRSQASNLVAGDTNNTEDVFVRDLRTGVTSRIDLAPSGVATAGRPSDVYVSAAGPLVAFDSGATDLVPGDTNASTDVFVRDLRTGSTERVSVG